MRKAYLAAGVAVLGIAALLLAPRFIGSGVEAFTVVPRDIVRSVVATGRVEAPHRVDLGAQIVGTVVAVPVAEGETVRAGQTLVQLDDGELIAAVREADIAVAQAQARLRQLQEVQRPVSGQAQRQAQATLDNARAQLQRQEDLFPQGLHRPGGAGRGPQGGGAGGRPARRCTATARHHARGRQRRRDRPCGAGPGPGRHRGRPGPAAPCHRHGAGGWRAHQP